MDFTREPIIESIITAKDGHRIVVRSSKNVGHEEYFVDALEVISFGHSVFFRSSERPRPFLVPATDYEVLEVREARVALKAPSIAGTVRIGPPKELVKDFPKEPQREFSKEPFKEPSPRDHQSREQQSTRLMKEQPLSRDTTVVEESSSVEEDVSVPPSFGALETTSEEDTGTLKQEQLQDKKKERRGRLRRRRGGREDQVVSSSGEGETKTLEAGNDVDASEKSAPMAINTLLPPPTTLIRDDIERLRKNETFKGAFYLKEDQALEKATQEKEDNDDDAPVIPERLTVEEDEPGEEIPHDSYKATPAKEVTREFREPFWIPPRPESISTPPESK